MAEQSVFCIDKAFLHAAGQVLPNAGWHMPEHEHGDLWEFIYFLKGCGRVETPSHTLLPQRYHLVVYPPGLVHAEWANPTDPEQTVFLVVAVPGKCPANARLLLPDRDGRLRWLAENTFAEYKAHGLSYLAHTYTRAFLQLVERCWHETGADHSATEVAKQYIQANYTQPLSVKHLAAVAHVSEAYFSHRFQMQTGISPMRYVQQVRIDAATRLLVTTSLTVSAVSRAVGFTDPLHFSRVFKRITGCTPTQMRQAGITDGADRKL